MNSISATRALLLDQHNQTISFEGGESIDPTFVSRSAEWAVVPELGFTHAFRSYAVRGSGHHSAHDGDIVSPMPGRIIAVEVAQGQTVSKGQKLLTLEAMKMEHSLTAPFDGVVAELNAEAGAQVQVEALLVRIQQVEET